MRRQINEGKYKRGNQQTRRYARISYHEPTPQPERLLDERLPTYLGRRKLPLTAEQAGEGAAHSVTGAIGFLT